MYMLMFLPRRRYHHNLRSTDGLTILANWLEIVAIWSWWPTAARRWRFALRDVSRRPAGKVAISRHLVTPGFPQCDHTVGELSADAGVHWKWSIADLLTSSHPQMSACHLLGLQVRANGPSCDLFLWNRIWIWSDLGPARSTENWPINFKVKGSAEMPLGFQIRVG